MDLVILGHVVLAALAAFVTVLSLFGWAYLAGIVFFSRRERPPKA